MCRRRREQFCRSVFFSCPPTYGNDLTSIVDEFLAHFLFFVPTARFPLNYIRKLFHFCVLRVPWRLDLGTVNEIILGAHDNRPCTLFCEVMSRNYITDRTRGDSTNHVNRK